MTEGYMINFRRLLIFMVTSLSVLSGCDIHEYPSVPETVEHEIHLQFSAETMLDWEFSHDWEFEVEEPVKATVPQGRMRYIIRLYPVNSKGETSKRHIQQHLLYGDVNGPYGDSFSIHLLPGEYDMMVWADWEIPGSDNQYYYDASDFANIKLTAHHGNSNYRDAFRGKERINILSDMYEHERETITVNLERPFAKYEIITDDLEEFVIKQFAAKHIKEKEQSSIPTKAVDLNDYKVKVMYPYMPYVYNMFSDNLADSKAGFSYESKIIKMSDSKASLGFDYVFVNHKDAMVSIQVAIYDNENRLLSLSETMNIPIKRNKHTLVSGSFLMQKASGGVSINPSFDGDINIIL